MNSIMFSLFQNSLIAMSCLLAVASANQFGYFQRPSQLYGAPSYNWNYNWMNKAPTAFAAPVAQYNAPTMPSDSKTLISAGVPRLMQAMAKLNELAPQLPTYLANMDPQTKSDIAKVNGIVNDLCARAIDEVNPTAYTSTTPEGLKEMCDYIVKIGNDIVEGLDNPAIFQKYTRQLNDAVTVLSSNAADLTL